MFATVEAVLLLATVAQRFRSRPRAELADSLEPPGRIDAKVRHEDGSPRSMTSPSGRRPRHSPA